MRPLATLALLAGCSRYFGSDDDSKPAPDATVDAVAQPSGGTCPASVALALGTGESNLMFAQVPVTLDRPGTTLCVRLDTTLRTHPTYFEAKTPQEVGPPSSFGIAIYDAEDHLLAAGYDAQLPSMQTYATASYAVMTNGLLYVKVRAWARQETQTTQLDLSLFQIID